MAEHLFNIIYQTHSTDSNSEIPISHTKIWLSYAKSTSTVFVEHKHKSTTKEDL